MNTTAYAFRQLGIVGWLVAKMRCALGFCPRCNSDAPEIDTCRVCKGHRWDTDGRPSKKLRHRWFVEHVMNGGK
jgi:hypothetical protein